MCIRDRLHRALRRPALEEVDLAACFRPDWSAHALAQVAACLLYTSDAADERSSVDLGGRRIIKKKNKSLYYRALTITSAKYQSCNHTNVNNITSTLRGLS